MTRPNIADLQRLFWGGGAEAEYQTLQQFADAGINAVTLLSGAGGGGGGAALQSTVVYTSEGVPTPDFGVPGDMYIDQLTGTQYVLQADPNAGWSVIGNAGATLAAPPDDANGEDGDFAFVQDANGDTLYVKTNGVWGFQNGAIYYSGNPNGSVDGVPSGTVLVDTATNDIYEFAEGAGDQWVELAVLAPASAAGGGGGAASIAVVAASGPTYTLDVSTYSALDITLDQDCVLAFSGTPSTYKVIDLIVRHSANGYSLSLPASTLSPAISSGAYRWTSARLVTTDGGANWFLDSTVAVDPATPVMELIQNTIVWLDASDSATLTFDGTNYTSWFNKAEIDADSNGSFDSAVGTGLVGTPINGLSTVGFDGSTTKFSLPSQTAGYLTSNLAAKNVHIFAVARPDVSVDGAIFAAGRASAGALRSLFTRPIGEISLVQYSPDPTTGDNALSTNEIALLEIEVTNAGPYAIRKNGVTLVTGTATNSGTTAATLVEVGALGTAYRFKGDLGELIVTNQVLSSDDAALLRNYLAGKWGIPLS